MNEYDIRSGQREASALPADKGEGDGVSVRPAQFAGLGQAEEHTTGDDNLDLILDVPLRVSAELGRTTMTIGEVLALGPGSIVEWSGWRVSLWTWWSTTGSSPAVR